MMEERLRLWSGLDAAESGAEGKLAAVLDPFSSIVQMLHDLPNWLTELPGDWENDEHILISAGLIKRCLDDLRALWILLRRGYTAAAGAVAADLWEHAMLACWTAIQPQKAERFRELKGDSKVSAWDLAQAVAVLAVAADGATELPPEDELEHIARRMYASYQMLCQLKHPSFRALMHTSLGSVDEDGVLRLEAHPNLRDDDAHLKQLIVAIAHAVLDRAILYLAVAMKVENDNLQFEEWMARRSTAEDELISLIRPDEIVLPFTISDTSTAKKLMEYREKRLAPGGTA